MIINGLPLEPCSFCDCDSKLEFETLLYSKDALPEVRVVCRNCQHRPPVFEYPMDMAKEPPNKLMRELYAAFAWNKFCGAEKAKNKKLNKPELEAARKQEPVGYFYLLDFSDTTIYQDKSKDDNFSPLYASPVPAQQAEALEALEVLSSAIDTLKTVADNLEWLHSDFPVIARAEKLLKEPPCATE